MSSVSIHASVETASADGLQHRQGSASRSAYSEQVGLDLKVSSHLFLASLVRHHHLTWTFSLPNRFAWVRPEPSSSSLFCLQCICADLFFYSSFSLVQFFHPNRIDKASYLLFGQSFFSWNLLLELIKLCEHLVHFFHRSLSWRNDMDSDYDDQKSFNVGNSRARN